MVIKLDGIASLTKLLDVNTDEDVRTMACLTLISIVKDNRMYSILRPSYPIN